MITAKKCKVQTIIVNTSVPNCLDGVLAQKVIDLADVVALLDASECPVDICKFKGGDVITEVLVNITAAATADIELDIGVDLELDGTTLDADGLIDGIDAQTIGLYSSLGTLAGAEMINGNFVCASDGYVTLTTDADAISDATLTGSIVINYLPG